MKIGILTFHCAHNYGAVLQCFGLQEYLRSLGHKAYIVNYRPDYIVKGRDCVRDSYKLYVTRKLSLFPKVFYDAIRLRRQRHRLWDNFEMFISNNLRLYDYSDQFDGREFDLCLVGSDQIWNKDLTGGFFDPVYFGVNFKCPVVSYAASTINKSLSDQDKSDMKGLLNHLSGISVREEKFRSQLNESGIGAVECVCDPTLLVGVTPFRKLVQTNEKKYDYPFIAVYRIRQDSNLVNYANRLSIETRLPIVEITTVFNTERSSQKIYDASVEDFLNIINSAEYVVTNSFHGTVFSILFQKDFVAIRQNDPVDDRIEQLLKDVGSLNRFVQYDSPLLTDKIDYSLHKAQMANIVNKSRMWLDKHLTDKK